eukprot:TRINITY_DN1567_c0_g1_i2.p2 TRINITY_DN1567_c0_g1~~TRINITY_DN1567_c0_g1_i2.p2  ORF type:complete len:295 (-),score=68.03 TRINITY_DN1567_c0_g1_i2:83-967(-)
MKGSDIWLMTREMETAFEKLFLEKFSAQENFAQLYQTVNQLQSKINSIGNKNDRKKGKSNKMKQDFQNKLRPLTPEEKQQLGAKIRKLPSIYFEGILKIVKDQMQNQNQEDVVFDINKLPTKVARDLEKYVNEKLSKTNKKPASNVQQQQQQQIQASQLNYNQPNYQLQQQQQQQAMKKNQKKPNIIPQQRINQVQNTPEFQQKMIEERNQVHQQMMQYKQQIQQQEASKMMQMQQQLPQQMFGMNQMPIPQIQQHPMPMPQQQVASINKPQIQENDAKSSSSSFLTDSEEDNI